MSAGVNVGMMIQAPPATAGGLAFEQRLARTFALGEGEPYIPVVARLPIVDRGVQGGEASARGVRA
jgi:hypothetical protein